MVWFQCEDCGDNLKKPKLPNHFRICSASRLSCIDCGKVFGQQTVEGHTQCITEAEKYGPKGQGKAPNGTATKPNNEKQKPDVDVNVGLSERPPWFCSLCNTNATSKQALLLHAEGKKHRAKARAIHAVKQQPKQTEESTPNGSVSTDNNQMHELSGNTDVEELKEQHRPEGPLVHKSPVAANGSLRSIKKRKLEASENDGARKQAGADASGELGNGEVIQVERSETKKSKCQAKKAKHSVTKEKVTESSSRKEDGKKKIKWKKLITSVLKSNPDSTLKMRKLKKLVLKTLQGSDFTEEETQLTDVLENKINSSSRFTVDGKYVTLVVTSS